MRRRNHHHGFSLLELALVLAIVTLVAQLSYPRISQVQRSVLLRSEAARIESILQSTATAAVLSESEIAVEASGGALSITGISGTKEYHLRSPLLFRPPAALSFYPTGAATPRSLTLVHESALCHIIVSLRGRVRVDCP